MQLITQKFQVIEHEADAITQAIHKDLRREPEMTRIVEINSSLTEIDYILDNLKVDFFVSDWWIFNMQTFNLPGINSE
jgi:uncharacterized protein Yka (UPF0111/DUF47 family)